MKKEKTQEIQKEKKGKTRLMLESLKATLKLGILVTLISGIALGGKALVDNEQYIQNRIAARNLAMTYEEVGENDNNTQNEHVKFDAYFLKNSGGTVKKLRGTAIELNERQEIYLELNVLTNGHLENGRITLNASNFNVARNIVVDQEIKSVSNSNNDIRLNNIQNGTYKTIPVLMEQTVVVNQKGNKDKLSKVNSVTFTGTHVAEDGTRTEISKTVEFEVDWYGSKHVKASILNKSAYIANQANDKVIIGLQAKIWSESINDSNIQVPDKAAVLTSTIPLLNGYAPTQVTVTDVSSPTKKLDYTYNQNTRRLEIREEVKYNEEGIGEITKYNQHYIMNINIEYPYVAYATLGASTKNLNITMTGQLEGYNNPNSEFTNPVKSQVANRTVSINLKNPEGDIVLFETKVDLLTKSKLRLKYDRNISVDNGYQVTWKARVNYTANIEKLIYEEDDENNDIGTERKYITDQMQEINGTFYDLTGLVDYVGIKIPQTSMNMLGQNGYVKVINTKTGEVIKTITAQESDKYIVYNAPVEHLRVETSGLENAGNFEIYHYKKINNQAFVDKYTKDQFNSMSLVYSSLNGSADFEGRESFINRDIDVAEYKDGSNSIFVAPTMQLNTQALNQTNTVISLISQFGYKEDKDLTEWVNPIIILEYPEEVENIQIKNIYTRDKELTLKDVIQKVVNGKKVITIKMEGITQVGSDIVVEQDIKVNSKTVKETGELRVFAYNELCDMWRYIYQNTQEAPDIYDINKNGNKTELRKVSITEIIYTKPTGLNTNIEALNFDDKGTVIMGPSLAEIEKQNSGREVTIRLNVYNNYNTPVTNAKIVGKIPFTGNTYQINGKELGSKFTTIMKNTGIILPNELVGKAEVYYSTHETVNENLGDSSNGWTKTPSDWSQVKTYLIDLSKITMSPSDSYTIDYNVTFPEKLTYGTASYATHAIYFEENTASGKVERSTETNRVGFSVITTKDYTLQLTKFQKDSTKTISGVRYKITGPGINEEGINYTTDAEGKITINNLYPEEIYTLEEIYAPNDYIKSEEPIEIETYLEDGNLKARIVKGIIKGEPLVENAGASLASIKIEVENEAKYDIQITKYKKGTQETIAKVRFNIKGKGFKETGKVVETNEQGKITITGLYPNEAYTLQETSVPSEYILDNTLIQFKAVEVNGQLSVEMISGTFKTTPTINNEIRKIEVGIENQPKYELEIIKYKKGTEEVINGVTFNLKGEGLPEEGRNITTNSEGKAELSGLLPEQQYTLQETNATNDYILNTEPIVFKLVKQENTLQFQKESGEIKTNTVEQVATGKMPKLILEIENEPKYELEIMKYETGTSKKLSNVKFLVKGKGMQEEGRTFITNNSGIVAIKGLELGETYTIKETYAKGYYVDETEFTVRVERIDGKLQLVYNGRDTKQEPVLKQEANNLPKVELSLENVKIPTYSLELTKIAEKTAKTLEGAKFEVIGAGRGTVNERQYVTAENGTLTIENLYENEEYTLREILAPVGYKLNEQLLKFKATQENGNWTFEVLEGSFKEEPTIEGTTVKVKWEDELLFKLEKVDEETGKPLAGAKYTIEKLDGNRNVTGYATDVAGNLVGEIENINGEEKRVVMTNEEGIYTTELAPGLYQATEVQAPFGYDLPKEPVQYFGIKTSQEEKEIKVISIEENTSSLLETNDGGYIIRRDLGEENMLLDSGETITGSALIKYNAEDKSEWSIDITEHVPEIWRGDGAEPKKKVQKIIQTQDDGYLLAIDSIAYYLFGYDYAYSEEAGRGYTLIKYTRDGKEEWKTSVSGEYGYNKKSARGITNIIETKDNGYLVSIYFNSSTIDIGDYTFTKQGDCDTGLVKYSNEGKVEWATSIGVENLNYISSIKENEDGKFFVNGYVGSTCQVEGYTLNKRYLLIYEPVMTEEKYKVEWAYSNKDSNVYSSSIVQSKDGGFWEFGKFKDSVTLNNGQTLTSNGGSDILLIKYKMLGTEEVEWATSFGGQYEEDTNDILITNEGDVVITTTTDSKEIKIEDKELVNPGGISNQEYMYYPSGIIAKYKRNRENTEYEVVWSEIIGGESYDYFESISEISSGRYEIQGGSESDFIQVGKEIVDVPNKGGYKMQIEESVVKETIIPQTQELTFQDSKKDYHIYTKVEGTGGTISGYTSGEEALYETVKYQANSTKDVIVIPQTGYSVKNITINGEEVTFTRNLDGSVKLDKFENMSEDKHIVVNFTANPAEVIVHHYIDGTTTPVPMPDGSTAQNEHIYGEVDQAYTTSPKTDLGKYELVTSKMPENANGTMTAEDINVIYYYQLKNAEVIVHHYIDGTTTPVPLPDGTVVEEEHITGKVDEQYQTSAKTDISGYRVVETKLPENGQGTMTEELIEVIYYYSPIPRGTVIVHHYIDGTEEKLAEDETIEGEKGDSYTTQPKTDLEKYELVEEKLPSNSNGIITEEPIEVIYYYRVKTVKITTEVEGIGGNISGQNENPYEIVEYGEDSIKDLIITPEQYYRVKSVTVNGQEIEFTADIVGVVVLENFKQMTEDKHIVVSFEKIPAGRVTVKYLEYGTNKELAPSEQREGNVGDVYTTQRKEIEGYKTTGIEPINANGMLTEEEQEVIYYYMRISGTVTVKYIDIDTGEEIANKVMIGGYVGEEYTTENLRKEIDRYIFVEEEIENEIGIYIEGNIDVVYRYQRIPAKVIVKYLEKGTEKELAQEEVLEGIEGDPYDVTDLEKDIKGYNKVEEKPANKEGEMTVEDITVVYYYERKPANVIENKVEKEGSSTLVIPIVNPKVSYTITYRAQIADYMGNAKVTITDYLPYEIDGDSAKLDGGTYNQAEKTITWEETIEDIDTYENGNKEIVITKQIEVVYKNMDFSKEGFVNKAKGKITFDTTNQEKETPEVEKETKFEKPEIEVETTVEKTGDEKITSTETPIYYEVNYTATINHFIGKAVVRFVDKLPYAIDEEKSDLSNFGTKTTMEELGPGKYVYNAEEKTITWEEVVEDINTFQALEAKVLNKTKEFSVQYIYDNNGETLSGTLENTVKATTDLVETKKPEGENPGETPEDKVVKTEEKQDEHSVAVEIPTKVIVHHYIYNKEKDEYTTIKVPSVTSGQVVQDEEVTGLVGENYTTAKSNQVARNYEVVNETPDKHEGTMTKTPTEVIYYYQLKEETIISEITKTAKADKTIERDGVNIEVLTTEGGTIRYSISYKVKIENYIGKATVKIVDELPTKINLENVDLKGGLYNRLNNTITWEEEITGIDTFKAGKAFETTITKEIELVYEGQNKVEPISNKVTGTVKTYYPDDYPVEPSNPEDPENPTKEKQTQTKEDTETVEQDYKVNQEVEKVWEDNENAKGKRPASVRVQLTANSKATWEGQALENVILSEANNWTHTFENLPKYDKEGNKISYSVDESEVNEKDLEYYETPEITLVEDQNKIIVTNSYKLVNTELESGIDKTGTERVTSTNQEVNYHIHYTANIKDYIGEAIVTITDTLPYHIDTTKSDLARGTYNGDTKTITWTQNLGHINTTQEETNTYPVSIGKDITLYYTDIVTTEDKMTNNIKGKIEFTENDTKNEVTDEHETLIDIKGRVITKYVEKATGEEIEQRKDEEGKVGLEYSAYPKKIYGYNFIEDSGNTVGKVIEGTIEIIFYYEKQDGGDVIVKYVDEEGNEIVPQETIEGKVGDTYKTEAKELDEYELEKVTGDPQEGTLDENRKEVVYHYKKRPTKVIVRYLEKGTDKPLALEETKEGRIGDSYETTRKVIEGYKKAEPEPENANGTMTKETIIITYYYEKIPSGKITVKYIEYETKQEITYQAEEGERKPYTYEISGYVGDKYETSEKEIPYYEYMRNLEPSNKTGIYTQDDDTVIYYYRKLPFNMAVDKKLKGAMVNNKEYNIGKNEKLTKIEVVASEIGKTKIEIKYVIKVRNTGEIEGTAKVVDRVPSGFKVASSNPSYWKEQEDGSIETTVALKAKESKELEVVLNWKNGNNNFGRMSNQVEITQTINGANYLETTLEDNKSEAVVVMSIQTGARQRLLITALGTIASLGLLVLLYQYQRYQKERERAIRHVVLEGKDVVIKKQKQK